MTEAKHTPGPWKSPKETFRAGHDGKLYPLAGVTVKGPDGRSICAFAGMKDSLEERHANARLIAAAPEMLEALRAAVANWDDKLTEGDAYPVWLEQARAAIAKAEGRS